MKLYIHMSPADVVAARPAANDVFIVIDVIRATTALTAIFDQGAQRVFAADTVEQARRAAKLQPGRFLCGERHARALPGFDYGNSPVQFSHSELRNRELILTTTNGTRAFYACPEHAMRLAGCFYNARAVTAYALAFARQQNSHIHIVCAAENGHFALDDAVCSGYLAQEILQQQPDIIAHESVTAARGLYQLYPPPNLAAYCHSARQVIDSGLETDIDFCMQQNGSNSIAHVTGKEEETGLLILERVSKFAS